MPAFFISSVMQSTNIDIIQALILIIPLHGIFLSLFFFTRSGWNLTPTFFLGLLLFIYSSITLFQVFYPLYNFIALQVSQYYFLCELLISPFLFLYNSAMIQRTVPIRKYSHLLIISIVFLLFLLTVTIRGPVSIIMIVVFILINTLYLAGSFRLIMELIGETGFGWKHLRNSEYFLMIFINLCIAVIVILNTFLYLIISVNSICLPQIPKALVIYYIYCRILKGAGFNN